MSQDAEKRAGYADRLLKRILEITQQEAPKGFQHQEDAWQNIAETDRMLVNVAAQYETGKVTREALDRAGALHLSKLRGEFERLRASRTR